MGNSVKRQSWIVTLAMAGAAVAYMMLAYIPGRRAIGEANAQLTQKRQYVVQASGLTSASHDTREKLGKTRTYCAAWRQNAPQPGSVSALYGKIYALAKDAGVTTTRFDPEAMIEYAMIRQIPLTLCCTGSFAEVFEFLKGLEGLATRIWINEMRLQSASASEGEVACELVLAIFTDNSKNSDYVEDPNNR